MIIKELDKYISIHNVSIDDLLWILKKAKEDNQKWLIVEIENTLKNLGENHPEYKKLIDQCLFFDM